MLTEQDIFSAALALPSTVRLTLIKSLTESLLHEQSSDLDDSEARKVLWYQETQDRAEAYDNGILKGVSAEEVFANLRQRHRP